MRKSRADAVTPGPNGKLYFAEPAVETMSMKSLLDSLSDDGVEPFDPPPNRILLNTVLRSPYCRDVLPSISEW